MKDLSKILTAAVVLWGAPYALAQDPLEPPNVQEDQQSTSNPVPVQGSDLFVNTITGDIVHISPDGQVTPATPAELPPASDQVLSEKSTGSPDEVGTDSLWPGRGGGWRGGRGWGWGYRGRGYGYYPSYYPYYPYYPYCNPYYYPYYCN